MTFFSEIPFHSLHVSVSNLILIFCSPSSSNFFVKYLDYNFTLLTFTFADLKNIPSENNPNKIPPTVPFNVKVACKTPRPSTKKINPNEKIP